MHFRTLTNLKTVSLLIATFFVGQFASLSLAQDSEGVDNESYQSEPSDRYGKKYRMGHRPPHHRKEAMQKLDTNGDEKVDLNEFLANAESRFRELDQNSDGYVTKDEASAKHREMREKHREMREKHRQMRERHREELRELRDEARESAEK